MNTEQTSKNIFTDLILVPANESKENITKYEELWSKIKDLIRSVKIKIKMIMMKNI